MDHRSEVQEFLRTRRARLTPDKANLIAGSNRRVPGLRREEVALLAGVSADYYAQLERGDLAGASDEVLDALARALQLDDAETSHLFDLARAAHPRPVRRRRPPAANQIRPSLQRFLDAITDAPAWVRDEHMDFIATNRLGRALNAPLFASPRRPVNNARFVFLNEDASRQFYPDLPADPGWHLFTFTAAPGSPSDDRLRLLASWAATLEHESTA
jgi:transcriptional regulator with XRE-family HTH domain